MTNPGSKTDIIIDLTKENLPGTVSANELIQTEAKDRLTKIIKNIETRLNTSAGANKEEHAHNVIFINGTRGSGKSTFLRAMMDAICKDNNTFNELAYIDPTLTETGEHIMMSLLARMEHQVQKKSLCSCGSNMPEESKYENWRVQLKNMSGGLTLLHPTQDGKSAKGYDGLDELIRLGKKMDNAQGGLELPKSFRELVQTALAVLGEKAFVVAFDDVDINFGKGWDVLELIRRYLCIPEIVVLITGDLQLYSQLVRDKQYSNFSATLSKNDDDRSRERTAMVDHLEQQYLMKLFPLTLRLSLHSVAELLELMRHKTGEDKAQIRIKYEENSQDKEEEIKKAAESMLAEGLSLNSSSVGDLALYTDALLRLPARSVLQIMGDYYTTAEEGNSPTLLSAALRGAMLGSLYKQQVDVLALENGYFPKLAEAIFNLTLEDGDLDTGFYLRPQSKEDSLRNTSMVLAAEVARTCKGRPDVALRYLLQGPGCIALYNRMNKNKGNKDDSYYKSEFIKYFALGKDESTRHWSLRSVAITAEKAITSEQKNGIGLGTLRINAVRRGKAQPSTEYLALIRFLKNVENRLKEDTETADALILLSVKAMHSVTSAAFNMQFLSVFNLIASVEQLLQLIPDNPVEESMKELDKEQKKVADELYQGQIGKTLGKIMSGNTVTLPNWMDLTKSTQDETNEDDQEDDSTETFSAPYQSSLAEIQTWLEFVRKNCATGLSPSSLLLGKVWTRFYFNLGKIQEENIAKNPLEFMRLNMVALLNAFLIEEYNYSKDLKNTNNEMDLLKDLKITMQNSTSNLLNFNTNIRELNKCVIPEAVVTEVITEATTAMKQAVPEWVYATEMIAKANAAVDNMKANKTKETIKAADVAALVANEAAKSAEREVLEPARAAIVTAHIISIINNTPVPTDSKTKALAARFPMFFALATCPLFRPFFFANPSRSAVTNYKDPQIKSQWEQIYRFQSEIGVLIRQVNGEDFRITAFDSMNDFSKIAIFGVPQTVGSQKNNNKPKIATTDSTQTPEQAQTTEPDKDGNE